MTGLVRVGRGADGPSIPDIEAYLNMLFAGRETTIDAQGGADATGATLQNTLFTTMARRACGLDDNGAGTVQTPKPIFISPGSYLLKAWNPTDAQGYTLPVNLVAYPGSVKITHNLAAAVNESSGSIDLDYGPWQGANKVQQQVTAITDGYAPPTFGIASAASNDDTVSVLQVADTTGFKSGDSCAICSQENLPHTNSSSSKSRMGEAFRILNVDATHLYVSGRLCFHDFYETLVYVTRLNTARNFRVFGIQFEGAATTVGQTTATPDQLDHGVWGASTWPIVSITRSGTTATVITQNPHKLLTGQWVHVSGAVETNYNVTVNVIVVDAFTFTYVLPAKDDANTTFGTAPGSVSTPATGTIVYADAFPSLDSQALNAAITVRNGPRTIIDECEFNACWAIGVRFMNSPEWRVRDTNSRSLPNAGTNANAYNGGRLGYVVIAYGHSSNGVWSGGVVRNARHAFTTGTKNASTYTPTSDTASGSWKDVGQPTQIIIENIVSYDAWGIPFDTHEEGSDITFLNCWAYNPQRGPQGGSYTGTGFQNRSRRTRFLNCGQRGGSHGIRCAATEQLGEPASWSNSSGATPLTYTVTSLTQVAGVATFVHGTGSNAVNTGAHLKPGDIARIRGADQENYNSMVQILTYTEASKTGTFTMLTKSDLGATFATLPANAVTPATGTITLQPIARGQIVVQNLFCEGLRKGKSGVVLCDAQNALLHKHKVLVPSIAARRVHCVINADQDCIVDVGEVSASQLVYDSSSDQSGCIVGVQANAVVSVAKMFLDCTDSLANAPGIYPARMVETASVQIGLLNLRQHPTYLACPRVFDDKDNVTGKFAGLGKLVYMNPGALNPATAFAIIQIGREPHFTWLGGGEELYLATHTRAVTNGSVVVVQRALGQPFIIRRAAVILDANAVGDVTVDVLMGGVSIFGANKIVIQAGNKSSLANLTQPTLSKLLLTDASELTATVISASGSETAKINGIALSGFTV